jgi:hypothetical protein
MTQYRGNKYKKSIGGKHKSEDTEDKKLRGGMDRK